MQPFIKLKSNFDILDAKYGSSIVAYGKGSIEFFQIQETLEQQLLSLIPENSRTHFKGSIMRITDTFIRPHTDSDRKVGINFYIKAENAITTFFEKKESTTESEKVKGQTNGFVFNQSDLIPGRKFIAKPGDIWILDVSKIHSVINPSGQERIAYSLSSNVLSYEETVELLKDYIAT